MSKKLDYELIDVTWRPPVVDVRLNRPKVRNAMNRKMEADIDEVLDLAEADGEIRAVTIRGNGPVFSSGHDLAEATGDMTGTPQRRRKQRQLPRSWYFGKALIAGVHGYVGPAANEWIATCDFLIAAEGTRFGFEQVRMGAESSGGTILNLQLPMRVIKKLWLMGGWFDAEKALQLDYVQRVVPPDQLDAETDRWANEAARTPPEHYAMAKEAIHRAYELRGLADIVVVQNKLSSRGLVHDQEFYERVNRDGLKEALKWRSSQFDPEVGKI
jgi:enoyl-CoA hydratase/carnithine racemase